MIIREHYATEAPAEQAMQGQSVPLSMSLGANLNCAMLVLVSSGATFLDSQ